MKNFKKLSRENLKDVYGGKLMDGGKCWVYERNTLQGNAKDYVGGGDGSCSNPPSGYHCKTYFATGSC